MSPDPLKKKTSQSVVESELGSAVKPHASKKGSSMPDELNRKDVPPIRGDLPEASKTEVLPDIADHVLIRCIGRGAYGEVWLGRNAVGGLHAVKVVSRKTFSDDRAFHREFEGLRKFVPISSTHPGFVHILHVGERFAEGYFYYVMELADDARTGQFVEPATYVARTLAHELTTAQRLPLATSLPIGLELASALAKLHEHKFIHRDIKPANIIFVKGVPKIADIGLVTEQGEEVTDVCTLPYRPLEGHGKPTGDIFSLGKVFYQLFMGQPVKSYPEVPGAAEEFTTNPALQQLNNLILKACDRNPERRFQTANELREALVSVTETVQGKRPGTRAGAADIGTGTKTPSGVSEGQPAGDGEQQPKARWTRMAALLVLLLAIAGIAFFFTVRHERVVVLMDTTAERGIYDADNKKTGNSNAKEVAEALRAMDFRKTLPPEKMSEVPVGLNWARKDHVRSLRPDLLIIHRSLFYHPWAVELSLPYPEFKTDEEFQTFTKRYRTLGDNPLREFLGDIGNAVPRTQFVVYSRGTDTNWLSEAYRQSWVKDLESQYPALAGRVATMVIPGGTNGTFRDMETRVLLRSTVAKSLKLDLPQKNEPEKRN